MDRIGNACDQRVSVLPTDDYVAVSPFTPLSQAIEAMKKDEGGCVIVLDDGRVAGIFTERDLLTNILGETVDLESPISQWMQPAVQTLSPEATVGDRSEEHTSELQSRFDLVCRLLLEKKKNWSFSSTSNSAT